jgi:hypothetical protein
LQAAEFLLCFPELLLKLVTAGTGAGDIPLDALDIALQLLQLAARFLLVGLSLGRERQGGK